MSKQEVYAAQAAYDSSLATYEAFRAKHNDVIEEHDHLALALSESLEVLKNALRNNSQLLGSQFGSFKIVPSRKYNYEALRDALGADAEVYTKTTHAVDSAKFEEAVKKGILDQEIVDTVVSPGTTRILGGPVAPVIYQR